MSVKLPLLPQIPPHVSGPAAFLFGLGLVLAVIKQFFDSAEHVLLSGCDPGWLIKTGQLILKSSWVPATDPFSWTCQDRQLVCYQWLFEVTQALLLNAGGLWLVGYASFVLAGILYLFVLPACWVKIGVKPLWTLLMLSLVFSPYWVMARPQTLCHLFIFAFIWLLERHVSSHKVIYLIALAPLAILWNNTHLSALLTIFILLAYLSDALISTFLPIPGARPPAGQNQDVTHCSPLGPNPRLCIWLALTTVIIALCLFINPYGFELLKYQLSYHSRIAGMDIIEMKGLSPADSVTWSVHLLIIFVALVLGSMKSGSGRRVSGRLPPIRWLILTYAATLASFSVTRLQPLVVLFIWLPVGEAFASLGKAGPPETESYAPQKSNGASNNRSIVVFALAALLVPIIIWCSKYPNEASIRTAFLGPEESTLSFYAINCSKQGRPFNDSDTGDRLIFLNAGPVFIDSRFDFYGPEFFRSWFECLEGSEPVWKEQFKRWKPSHLLVKDTYKLYWDLMSSPDWLHVVDDGSLSLWMPNSTATIEWLSSHGLDSRSLKNARLGPEFLASTVTGRACKHASMGKKLKAEAKLQEALVELSQAFDLVPSEKIKNELSNVRASLKTL